MLKLEELELLDFHVSDVRAHANAASAQELPVSARSGVSARSADPFDGILYLTMSVTVNAEAEDFFSLELQSETVMKLPEYKTSVSEEDAPACIALARRETHRAIRELTAAMGIRTLDLDAAGG